MSAQNKPEMREWRVVVHMVGDIGSVIENSEELARCAALSKYAAEPGDSREATMRGLIFEDDTFFVRPS